MKRLLTLRHAKSSWKDPDLPDHDSKYLATEPSALRDIIAEEQDHEIDLKDALGLR
jgi:phosphohistidine phosphatase SixA